MVKPSLPSFFLPDFLRMDLNVGTDAPHPLIQALDETFATWEFTLLQRAHSLQPEHYSLSRQTEVLEHLGFSIGGLSGDQIAAFFQSMHQCLDNPGCLESLQTLAKLHFGEVTVSRGLPYRREKLAAVQSFPLRLHDTEASKTILFVRLSANVSKEIIETFQHNAKLLIPAGFSVLVSPPTVVVPEVETRISLKKPLPLNRRKL